MPVKVVSLRWSIILFFQTDPECTACNGEDYDDDDNDDYDDDDDDYDDLDLDLERY